MKNESDHFRSENGETIFYSSRAPDGQYSLIVETLDNSLVQKLEKMHERWRLLRERTETAKTDCEDYEYCAKWRSCPQASFIPTIVHSVNSGESILHELRFECFDLAKFTRMSELAKNYSVGPVTAFRIALSLFALAERLLWLDIDIRLKMDNLLVDLDSSRVLIFDWNEAELCEMLDSCQALRLQCDIAQVVIELADAEVVDESWCFGFSEENGKYDEIFNFLQGLAKLKLSLGYYHAERLNFLFTQVERSSRVLERFIELLNTTEISPQKSLYEIQPRKKPEELQKEDAKDNDSNN